MIQTESLPQMCFVVFRRGIGERLVAADHVNNIPDGYAGESVGVYELVEVKKLVVDKWLLPLPLRE